MTAGRPCARRCKLIGLEKNVENHHNPTTAHVMGHSVYRIYNYQRRGRTDGDALL